MTTKRRRKQPKQISPLELELCAILAGHVGERYENRQHGEGAVEVLERIIFERDRALEILALDRLKRPY
jgi:hypothetical protein